MENWIISSARVRVRLPDQSITVAYLHWDSQALFYDLSVPKDRKGTIMRSSTAPAVLAEATAKLAEWGFEVVRWGTA